MNNATLIYEKTDNYSDIQKFVDQKTPEDMFLDFKESQNPERGKMEKDDKAHYSKAASGFAHQEGGVLIWGIKARKDEDGANYADGLKPLNKIKTFLSDLYDYVQYSTEPVVDRIQHKVIYENNDESVNKGFAVSLFPKSDEEHIAKGRNTSDFYKRYGDSFVPLGTADIKALFLRNRLLGLRNQLIINIAHWADIRKHTEGDGALIEVNTSILTGLDLFLSEPVHKQISERDLYNIRKMANGIDMINSRLFMGLVDREMNKKPLLEKIISATQVARKVIADIDGIRSGSKPL